MRERHIEVGAVYTAALGREVYVREGTADRQVWGDTFTGLYHVPPELNPTPRLVLDCGANIGLTAAHYEAMWPAATVVAVEMNAENAAFARRNFAGRVLVHAVAGEAGERAYASDAAEDGYALAAAGDVRVDALTLAETIDLAFGRGETCDLVKLDVEGAEVEVVRAATSWRDRVRRLLVEFHGQTEPERRLLLRRGMDDLYRAGYGAVRHERHPNAVWAVRND